MNYTKKILITTLLSTSLNLYAGLFSTEIVICDELEEQVQIRNGVVYLPNQAIGFTGLNSCVYLKNGQKRSLGNYKNGEVNSEWTKWFENGQKSLEANYEDGKKDGEWNGWFENGQKSLEANYEDGKYTQWYENGTKAVESNYKDGKLDGKKTRWHGNGTKAEESNYIDGKLDGKYTRWIDNGLKYTGSNYIDGKKTSFIVMRLKKIGINPKKWYFVIFTVVIIFFLNQIH